MGAPPVIEAPKKSYVVINSIGSDRSIPPTMCDLGRVSSIAAAVTVSRTSNIANRNNSTQNTRSIHHRKKPISEVLDNSSTKPLQGNTSTELSTTNQISANTRFPSGNQSSISASSNPSTVDNNSDRRPVSTSHAKRIKLETTPTNSRMLSTTDVNTLNSSTVDNNPVRRPVSTSHAKRMKLESTVTNSRMLSTTDISTLNNQNNISVTIPEIIQTNLSTPHHTSQSTNLPSRILTSKPDQVSSQVSEAEVQSNTSLRTHTHNATHLHSEQAVPLPTPGMGMFQCLSSPSIALQLQQQNEQLRSENMILKKQLSLFRQLIKNPQRLNGILTRLDQRAQ